MPELEEMVYSQEETVRAFRDYFVFLEKMYLEGSLIREPPPGGWPDITSDTFRGMDKTQAVIDLLRHLPYLDTTSGSHYGPEVAPRVPLADYQREASRDPSEEDMSSFKEGVEGEYSENIPSHVVAISCGKSDSHVFLLDTDLGVVYWIDCQMEIKHNYGDDPSFIEPIWNDPYEWAEENEADWRNEPCWAVPDFFEVLKQQFRRLNWVPFTDYQVRDVLATSMYLENAAAVMPFVQEVYRKHGWPDAHSFRKEECKAAVIALLEERDPDYNGY